MPIQHSDDGSNARRAVFLNLAQIQMPVGAVTSITHRITGVLLVIGIPFFLCLLDLSLQSPQSYAQVMTLFGHAAFKLLVLVHFLRAPAASYTAWHTWVGMHDIILDYVKPLAIRVFSLTLLGFFLVGLGTWVIRILWTAHS